MFPDKNVLFFRRNVLHIGRTRPVLHSRHHRMRSKGDRQRVSDDGGSSSVFSSFHPCTTHLCMHSSFTFIVAPLVHPRYYRNDAAGVTKQRDDPLTRSDMLLSTNDWGTVVVGKLSPWICLHSAFDSARKNAEKVDVECVFCTRPKSRVVSRCCWKSWTTPCISVLRQSKFL